MIKERLLEVIEMKTKLLVIFVLILFTLACNFSLPISNILETIQTNENIKVVSTIESGITETLTPQTIPDKSEEAATLDPASRPPAAANIIDDIVVNPTSGNKLAIHIGFPQNIEQSNLPTMVLVPGGIGDSSAFLGKDELMGLLTKAGFLVVVFDADGRGKSEGEENFNGFIHQDGLAAVIEYAVNRPESDGTVGLLSTSYGVTMASGTLSRYPDLPVRFYIDWEGPAERFDTTVNCSPNARIDWAPCDDEAFWSEREALRFISSVPIPYLRVQSEVDHVQADNDHALNMLYAAMQGTSPWVRLNDYPANQEIDFNNPPVMMSEEQARRLNQVLMQYILELNQLF
jgi:pimeloyl-ACP methyl ester carboxylesterase